MTSSKISRICRICGIEFLEHAYIINRKGGGQYCSQTCYGKSRKVKRVEVACQRCALPFSVLPSRIIRGDGKFCSRQCSQASRRVDIADRFWSKVHKTQGCWIWVACKGNKGYGGIRAGKEQRAHRVAYILTYGDIDDNLCVLHRCDNPSCVRPDHLFLGTQQQNIEDCVSKKRNHFGEKSPQSKLSDEIVKQMRIEYASGQTIAKISAKFNAAYSITHRAINKKAWKHVK